MSRTLAILALFGGLGVGCVPAALDLNDRACPCTTGWTCDTARNRCVLGDGTDAARPDASIDAAASPDTGVDAALDAFRPDSGIDAFVPSDAGTDAPLAPDTGSDAGHDGGMPGSTGCSAELATAIVCDGFETDPGPWVGRNEHLGTVVGDGLQAARGNRSLHAQTTAGSGHGARYIDTLGPYTSGDLWVRAYVYIPAAAPVSDFTWLSIGESAAPYAGISLGMGTGNTIGSYSTVSMTYVADAALTLTRDTWTCLELHVAVSDTAGVIEIYRNGTLAASHTGLDTNPGSGFSGFGVGIDYTDPMQAAMETWVDEVALSRSRLPCP